MTYLLNILGLFYGFFLRFSKRNIFGSSKGKAYLNYFAEAEVKNVFFKLHARFRGYKLIDNYKDSKKKSDTIFILGSGESINDLTSAQWDLIKSKNILGLNYSFVHDVIPDYHLMEMIPLKEMQDFFCEVTQKKYQDVDMFFQYKHVLKSDFNLKQYSHQQNILVHVPHLYPTIYPEVLELYFRNLLKKRKLELSDLVHHNSHIGCAVMFAQILGYKHIVMLGIDLNGGDYFTSSKLVSTAYPSNENYNKINALRTKHFESTQEYMNSIHPTIDEKLMKERGGLSMDEYFEIYSKVFFDNTNVTLYSGSNRSKLSEFLPVFKFEE
jgi:hypothetical protein